MKRLVGKVAVVTGGSRGIGKATSLKLASEGAFVYVQYNTNEKAAQEVLKTIEGRGGRAHLLRANFKNLEGVRSLFTDLDKIDILVNNAGMGCIEGIETMEESIFDDLFSLNVKAPFFLVQEAIPKMNDGGRIINVSSIVTRMALPSVGAYSMTKGAINTMTLWLAKQLGPRKISVNAVAPGVIDTEMNAVSLSDPNSRKFMESLSTFGRVGQAEDVADVIAFLASDDARWISGECIEVSGGSFLGC